MTTNSVKPLWLIINKANGYIEESNGNKYLTLDSTDQSTLKKYEELQNKIGDLVRSISNALHNSKINNSDN